MVRIHRSRPIARAVVALAATSLVATACGAGGNGGDGGAGDGEGDATGVTDTTVKIGSHQPLTGPVAPGYSEISTGHQAYFDFVNAQGGVNGREIEYVVRDDVYNPSQTTQVVNQLVLQDEIFAMFQGLGTPTHGAVVDFLNEQEVPDLFVSSGSVPWGEVETNPWTFGWQPNYAVEGKILGQFIAENYPDARVGLFLQQDDLGRDGAEGLKQFIEDQVVAEVTYVPTNLDVSTQVAQLQQAGADFIVGFNVPAFTAGTQLAARRLNYNPQWAYTNVGSDASLVGGILNRLSEGQVTDGEGALEGIYTTQYIPVLEDEESPWIQRFQEIWDEHGNGEPVTNFRIYGMSAAYAMVSALLEAGDDLTREGIVAAIEEGGSDWEGPWVAPLEYSEETHRGITGMRVVQVTGGEYVPQGEVKTTDAGDGEIEDYTEEPFTPTEDGLPNVG